MYKFTNEVLTTFIVEISTSLKSAQQLTETQKQSITDLLAENNITAKSQAYDFLNGLSYEEVSVPEVKENKPTFVSDLRMWWRLILPTIQNQQLREGWEAKSAKALAFYNSNEQILRDSVIVDGKETNTFYSFAQEALNTGVITEEDLDDLFQTVVSPASVSTVPYRRIDRICGVSGNIISIEELAEILGE